MFEDVRRILNSWRSQVTELMILTAATLLNVSDAVALAMVAVRAGYVSGSNFSDAVVTSCRRFQRPLTNAFDVTNVVEFPARARIEAPVGTVGPNPEDLPAGETELSAISTTM